MNECIFCKIVNGSLPCYKIYESEKSLAFLDRSPVHKGHTLVIPKKHSETIIDTDEDILRDMVVATKKTSKAIYEGLKIEGFNIGINQFEAAGQVVPHLHIHIIPRYKNDGLKSWPSRAYGSEDEIRKSQEKITRLLK